MTCQQIELYFKINIAFISWNSQKKQIEPSQRTDLLIWGDLKTIIHKENPLFWGMLAFFSVSLARDLSILLIFFKELDFGCIDFFYCFYCFKFHPLLLSYWLFPDWIKVEA